MTTVYRADPAALRITTPLDGLTLVYQRPSGATHLVSEPVPQILELMGDEGLEAGAILARLIERHDVAEGVEALEVRLDELCRTGLLSRT